MACIYVWFIYKKYWSDCYYNVFQAIFTMVTSRAIVYYDMRALVYTCIILPTSLVARA